MLNLTKFPVPVGMDDHHVYIHRAIEGDHIDSGACWCCPTMFTREEVAEGRLARKQLNWLILTGVH